MNQMLVEENKIYGLDCSEAKWATDKVNSWYHKAGLHLLKDADFVVETESELIIIEYKNAAVPGAVNPGAFNPLDDKKVNSVVRKYYDTLHYLTLVQKTGPKRFVYIIEVQNGDSVMRKRLRERFTKVLPFQLQKDLNTEVRLIDGVDVLSITEWNTHPKYKKFPLKKLQ